MIEKITEQIIEKEGIKTVVMPSRKLLVEKINEIIDKVNELDEQEEERTMNKNFRR